MKIKDSGKRSEFETGAVRDAQEGKGRFDLLPMFALLAKARHYEDGGIKYDDRNWEKGVPIGRFIDSAMRHISYFVMGKTDEPHLVAAGWNIDCAVDTLERIKLGLLPAELDDLPYPLKIAEVGVAIDNIMKKESEEDKSKDYAKGLEGVTAEEDIHFVLTTPEGNKKVPVKDFGEDGLKRRLLALTAKSMKDVNDGLEQGLSTNRLLMMVASNIDKSEQQELKDLHKELWGDGYTAPESAKEKAETAEELEEHVASNGHSERSWPESG